MNPKTLIELAEYAADCAAIDGDNSAITSATFGEMADGSRRYYALVEVHDRDNGLDQTYRVSTPAPDGAPRWARAHADWKIEVRIDDLNWLELEGVA